MNLTQCIIYVYVHAILYYIRVCTVAGPPCQIERVTPSTYITCILNAKTIYYTDAHSHTHTHTHTQTWVYVCIYIYIMYLFCIPVLRRIIYYVCGIGARAWRGDRHNTCELFTHWSMEMNCPNRELAGRQLLCPRTHARRSTRRKYLYI